MDKEELILKYERKQSYYQGCIDNPKNDYMIHATAKISLEIVLDFLEDLKKI